MDIIRNESTRKALHGKGRVYLCGNLQKDNGAPYYPTDGYEIGISEYAEYTFEKAHIHTFNTEFNYVIEGKVKILLLRSMEEFLVKKGDLFIIHPDEPYVCKEACGTKVLFSKFPGGNDKELIPMCDAIINWGEDWEKTI